MSVIDFTFKFLSTLLQPVCWFKYFAFSLGAFKNELCSFLNSYYQVDTFKPDDYNVRVHIFDGFYIYNKYNKDIIASSNSFLSEYVEIKIENIQSKDFPVKQLSELNLFFKVEEKVTVWRSSNKIDKIQNTITLCPHKQQLTELDEEEVYIDIGIHRSKDGSVYKLYKEMYDFTFMHGNQIDFITYPNDHSIDSIFTDIVLSKSTSI
jgi:hypothetical protein